MHSLFLYALLLTAQPDTTGHTEKGKTLNKDTTFVLWYAAIGCSCAQWIDASSDDHPKREYYYLEPANDKLLQADDLWDGISIPLQVQVRGKIITTSGFSKSYAGGKSRPDPGNVIRYTQIKVLRKGKKVNAVH